MLYHKKLFRFVQKVFRKGIVGIILIIYYDYKKRFYKLLTKKLFIKIITGKKRDFQYEFANTFVDLKRLSTISFFNINSEKEKILNIIPIALRKESIDSAELIMSNHFKYKSFTHHFLNNIDWFYEPEQNKGWRWDLNRHDFMLVLAKAFVYSKNEKYLTKIEGLIMDWQKDNPLEINGRNWNEPFEVAARLSNWIWLYFLLNGYKEKSRAIIDNLNIGIFDHGCYLYRLLEIHIPNNHLLLEALALYHASFIVKNKRIERKWKKKSLKYINKEINRQINSDGGHSEQAITYHRIINSELWVTYVFMASESNINQSELIKSKLIAMTDFLNDMMRPDGSFPMIGDSSAVDTYYRFNPFMIAATLLDRPKLKTSAIRLGENDLTYFFLGEYLSNKYKQMISEADNNSSSALKESGYYIMRDKSPNLFLLLDCGYFGDKKIPAHGHDDILSLDLAIKNIPLIIDAGNDGLPIDAPDACIWREYFRGVAAHNTLSINHFNRSQLYKYKEVYKTARPISYDYYENDKINYFSGAHDGYYKIFGIIHERQVILIKRHFIIIIDRLLGNGSHEIEINYHLSPNNKAILEKQHISLFNNDKTIAKMSFFGTPGKTEIIKGKKNPIQGWVSLESGYHHTPTETIKWNACSNIPICVGTLIQYSSEGNESEFKVTISDEHIQSGLIFNFSIINNESKYDIKSKTIILNKYLKKIKIYDYFSLCKKGKEMEDEVFINKK